MEININATLKHITLTDAEALTTVVNSFNVASPAARGAIAGFAKGLVFSEAQTRREKEVAADGE